MIKTYRTKIAIASILLVLSKNSLVNADILDSVRDSKATVLYKFDDTSDVDSATGTIYDKSNRSEKLNLQVHKTDSLFFNHVPKGTVLGDGTTVTKGYIDIKAQNYIRSTVAATKITNECKTNQAKGLTIEMWVENKDTVQKRAFNESDQMNARPHPLRMLTLSKGLKERNFTFGQFYEDGDLYIGAVNTAGNEAMSGATQGNSLTMPLMSKTTVLNRREPTSSPSQLFVQKIVMTVKAGIARLYLTDKSGRTYLAQESTQGFDGNSAEYFKNWYPDARLVIGNEYLGEVPATIDQRLGENYQIGDNNMIGYNTLNRYWRGKVFLVAVYCEALAREDVLGTGLQLSENDVVANPVDNMSVTPELKKALALYQRLTSSKASVANPDVQAMAALITNQPLEAAKIATAKSAFYNITVRDFASRMSNREESVNTPLNDFTASIIGAVRDNMNAKDLLTENFWYKGNSTVAVPSEEITDILKSNNHYEALGSGRFDLSKVLVKSNKQILFDGKGAVVDNPTPAGLFTSRQWMAAHAIAGTNRRLVEFSLRVFLCSPLEIVADSSGPDNVVGKDIDRYPGGSHSKFETTCKACHTIMDGFRPAFAYFTFSNGFVKHSLKVDEETGDNDDASNGMKQFPKTIAYKYNKNSSVFPQGKLVENTKWTNNANRGSNASKFGWYSANRDLASTAAKEGDGIQEFGKLIVNSKQYPICLAERVFTSVCKKSPADSDQPMIKAAAKDFEANNFNIKYLFERVSTTSECLGKE